MDLGPHSLCHCLSWGKLLHGASVAMSKMRLPSYIRDSIWSTKFGKVIHEINIGVLSRTLTFVLIIFKKKELTRADP